MKISLIQQIQNIQNPPQQCQIVLGLTGCKGSTEQLINLFLTNSSLLVNVSYGCLITIVCTTTMSNENLEMKNMLG